MTDRRPPLAYLLKALHQAVRTEIDEGLRAAGLTMPQLVTLSTLHHAPGASNAELARAAFVAPQSMGEVLAGLEAAGWVAREADPANARIRRARTTAKGLEALKKGGIEVLKVEARLVADLAPAEQETLRGLLEKCVGAMARPASNVNRDSRLEVPTKPVRRRPAPRSSTPRRRS